MKYLCLCYYDIDTAANLSPEEAAKIGPACQPHDEILKATGKLLVHASLAAPETWSYFVPKDGKQPEHAGHAMHTLFVDDLDALVAQIAKRGLDPAKQETYANGVRKITYRDADRNEIGFGGAPLC